MKPGLDVDPCEELVQRAKEAYAAGDAERYEKLSEEAMRICSGDIFDALIAETAARDLAYYAAREVIASAMGARTAEQKAAHIVRLWNMQAELAVGCMTSKAFIAGMLKAADEAGWPRPRWILAAPLIEAVYRQCGDDVIEEIAEMLGDEWPAAESFVLDRAARVEIDGVPVTVLSPWS